MRNLHLFVGLFGLLVFLATGLYMLHGFPGLFSSNEALRYLYRASHVYMLFSSLLNIMLGIYLVRPQSRMKVLISRAGSVMAILASVLLAYAFFAETSLASPNRPFTALGILLLLLTVACQFSNFSNSIAPATHKNR